MLTDFRHSEDYKILMIKADAKGFFKVPKNGRRKYRGWKEELQKLGYLLPAVYLFEWNSKEQIWVGELQEVTEAPV